AAASATTAAAKLGAEVDAVVLDNGFADVADALGALRDSSRVAALEKSLLDAEREQSAHSAVLLEPEVVDAMSGVVVDVGPVDRAEELARLRVEEAVAAASDAERRSRTLRTLVTELWAAADLLGPLHAEHRELDRLATVVAGRGENDRKMSLRSYVLAARLEDVAIAASVRFRAMSGGRYEFVHSDDAGPRGTRGGLGLEVRDDYTGVVRAAGTLSGGESFCASLSLALGLADVVAAESGGVTLDTMFIDEGFGTLDAASLDAVMGVLDELRSGGRTVGIVSHVDEIRDRVPSRLEVIRDRRGSSVRVHAAV
ncbi:MAG: SbcC/MukB-like Walker B domain-containing protein, partial [Rhodococcus sp. (in: high G+C Gram-positive bacteria)]